MDGGAWWAAVQGVLKSQTRLSDFTFPFHFHVLVKEMATHSSVLAWRIPGTGEPGGLPSMGSHRVRHDWSDLAAAEEGRSRERRCKALDNYWVRCNSPHKRLPSLLTPITSAQDCQSPFRSDNSLGRSKQLNENFFYSWQWFKHD